MKFKYIILSMLIVGGIAKSGAVQAECATLETAYRSSGATPLNVWYTDCSGGRKKGRVEELGNGVPVHVSSNVVIGFFDDQNLNYLSESTVHDGMNIFTCEGGLGSTTCKRER